MTLSTNQVAEKFIEYYWRQVRPFYRAGRDENRQILPQNSDRQATIVKMISQARQNVGDSMLHVKCTHSDEFEHSMASSKS
jgi:hypothetical protein